MSKYAFVTGGSRGIGRAVCVKLAQMGFCVIVNYVSNDAAGLETTSSTPVPLPLQPFYSPCGWAQIKVRQYPPL